MLRLAPTTRLLQQLIEQLLARTEVGLLQARERNGKVREAMLRRISEHAQRPKHSEAESLGFFTGVTVVNKERIGRQYSRKFDGFALAVTEPLAHSFEQLCR
jgi:hypothetical protein